MFKQTVLLLALVGAAFAAVALAPLETPPEKYKGQEGCYIRERDIMIPFDGSIPSNGSCMEYRCGTEYIQYVTCGVVVAEPPCYTVEDITQEYPNCCAIIECPSQECS